MKMIKLAGSELFSSIFNMIVHDCVPNLNIFMSSSMKSYRSDLVNFEKNEENIIPTIDTDQTKEIISTS